ncbi:MAG: hypothetical protein U9O96_00990 [Candidatus Thermoplasmatota archaeon]|nr:hypothetical protein [Candidatus Thermoplasmatota archaeon]
MDIGSALLPIGIIPALFILYFTLGGYENKFKGSYIFLTFIGGIAIGTLVYFMEIWFLTIFEYDVMLQAIDVILIVSFIFAFFENLTKLVVLNLPKFQHEEGIILYGASIGLGFASPSGAVLMRNVPSLFSMQGFYVAVLAISILFLSCSTGTWIGVGIKRKQRMKYLAIVSLMGLAVWPIIFFRSSGYVVIIAIIYSAFIYIYTIKAIRPYLMGRKGLKEVYKRKWLRKI